MISILIAVHNEEKFIRETVESIKNQTYPDWEVIIVDDGSTDKTYDILEELSKQDKRIKIAHINKSGKNAAWNFAAKMAQGEWFMPFAGDDKLPPSILEQWHNIIKKENPDKKVIVQSKIQMFAEGKYFKKYNGLIIPKKKGEVCNSGGVYLASRSVLKDMFPIPGQLPNEDGWSKLYFNYFLDKRLKYPEIACLYRIHDGNSINKEAEFKDFTELYHKRAQAVQLFIERYKERLDKKVIIRLETDCRLEEFRYSGKGFRILMLKGVDLKGKVRAICFSNKLFYNIKVAFNNIFMGRG